MNKGNGETSLIKMFHVYRRYDKFPALFDINFVVEKNEFVFINGPSGAGKTTLLKLLYMGEPASEGQILIDGINLSRLPKNKIPLIRRNFGIIFQDFKLIPSKTVFENVALVPEAAGKTGRLVQKKVSSVLRAVGMEDKQKAFPLTLSGGEQQRVAIARAVAGDPKIILADEPTGSLDSITADHIFEVFEHLVTDQGKTIIMVTHDMSLAGRFSRSLVIADGELTGEARPDDGSRGGRRRK